MPEPAPSRPREQEIRIPAGPPAWGIVAATALAAAVTALSLRLLAADGAATLAENPGSPALPAFLGVVGSGIVTLATGFIFYGARPRPAGDCATRWMGATVARFLAIPLLCVSIYFSLPAGGQFAVLASVGTYLACLAVETATVAWTVNRSLNDAST